MRTLPVLLPIALLALALPAALAETISFTPTGGTTTTITASAPSSSTQSGYRDYFQFDGPGVTFYFFAPDEQAYLESLGYGNVVFEASYNSGRLILDGPTLFTGSVTNPILNGGVYDLVGDPAAGNVGGQLVITNVSATPEPSSLVLLGTGAIGMAAMMRRRFRRA